MSQPSVSVVVPCYNGGRFLPDLLANLRLQTFRDFEIVVVDDGSSEAETLSQLAQLSSEIRVIRQENRGLPAARNTGIRNAHSDFVLPLDCDDELESDFLTEAVPLLRSAPADVGFVFTHMRLSGAVEGIFETRFNRFDQLFVNRLPYCMLLRKSAWTKAGGYDETMRDGAEDWEFNIRLAEANFRGIGIARPLFVYTVRPEGMLLSKTAHLQGTMWRSIRSRHAELYRLQSLIKRWQESGYCWRSAFRAIGILLLVSLLPERRYNALCFKFMGLARGWRIMRGRLNAKLDLA